MFRKECRHKEVIDMNFLNALVSLVNVAVDGQYEGGVGMLPMMLVVWVCYKVTKAEVKIFIHWK